MTSRREILETAATIGLVGASGLTLSGTAAAGPAPSQQARNDIPPAFLAEYRSTAAEYGIAWPYLAGIGKVETNHNRYNPSGGDCIYGPPTRYGRAKGPMQFIDSTWRSYGVDGDGDGRADPCNFRDAIPAAARYLTDHGAPNDWRGAIWAYNHSNEYVNDVISWAHRYWGDAEDGNEETRPEPTFDVGNSVIATEAIPIRSGTTIRSGNVKHAARGWTRGTIIDGPKRNAGYVWWKVDYEIDVTGWSTQVNLTDPDEVSLDGYKFESEIRTLIENGVVSGYENGEFRPARTLTRAEYATMLNNALDLEPSSPPTDFEDVQQSHWAYPHIRNASRTDFLQGYPDGTFRPDRTITKAELVTSLATGLDYSGGDWSAVEQSYADASAVPEWAREAFASAHHEWDVIPSVPTNSQLNPNTAGSRGEAAKYIYEATR